MRTYLTWKVDNFNINKQKIEKYDVLANQYTWIQNLKKTCTHKDEFNTRLDREMLYRYWSRSEYELLLEREDNQLYLKPWCGCRNPDEVMEIVTDDPFWSALAKSNKITWQDDIAKISIYDQLRFDWSNFIEYCWRTK